MARVPSARCSVAYRSNGGRLRRSGTRNWRRGSDGDGEISTTDEISTTEDAEDTEEETIWTYAVSSASNSPPNTSSTPSDRSHSAFSGAYSPNAQMRARA